MKVLLFTLEYPPFRGGIANYNENVVKFWPDKNIAILNNNDDQLINTKLPAIRWLPAIFALRRLVKKEGIDHVLVAQILPLGTATMIVSLFTKIKYSVFIHGTDLNKATLVTRKKFLAKKILSNCHKIICNSYYVAGLVESLIGKNDKISVVSPGIAKPENRGEELETSLKNKYGLSNKLILLSVGRLVKRKGVDTVLESMPEALKQIPNLIYVVVGNGPELSNLQFLISNLGLQDRAIIITDADDQERNAWYNFCDIYISAGREVAGDIEGFGIAMLEANLAGKPVIAGRSGGATEAVADGVGGLLIDAADKTAIIHAITKLAGDETLRHKLGEQGRERALKNFDWQKQVEKIYQIINL